MKELPQKEEASSARERLGETLWQFDLWPTYRVIALPIVEIEEKERVARSRGRKKKGVVRDESMNAQTFFFSSRFFRDWCSIIILPLYIHYTNIKFKKK